MSESLVRAEKHLRRFQWHDPKDEDNNTLNIYDLFFLKICTY